MLRRGGLALAGALMVVNGLPLLLGLGSVSDATPATDGNEDLESSCGLDVTLVLDDSGSIDSNEAALVRSGAQLFADALVGTPSRLKTIVFSTRAQGVNAAGSLTSDLSDIVFRDPALYTAPTSGAGSGGTNWDDGLETVRRSTEGGGDLTVFLTDGEPTYRNTTTPDGHLDDGSHSISGTGNSTSAADLSQAVTEADSIKATGTHMFGLGIGLSGATAEQRLNDVSGDDEMSISGGVPSPAFSEADYIIAPNFTDLQTVVSAFVRELCGDSLNVTKYEQKADGTTAKATAGAPWSFTATLDPAPTSWDTPPGAVGNSANLATDANGGASFSWDQGVANHVSHTADLVETVKTGWVYNGAKCTANDLQGNTTELFDTVGTNAPGQSGNVSDLLDLVVGPYKAVNCEVYNRQLRTSTIQVSKVTSPAGLSGDFDFDLVKGGQTIDTIADLSHGETDSFDAVGAGTYTVTETPAAGFTQSAATCDNLVTQAVETASPVSLVVGESQNWKCTFTNTANPGSIKIVKNTVGADGTFNFTSNIPSHSSFGLTTSGGTASTATFAAPVGTYSVSEVVPAKWNLTNATCTGGDSPASIHVAPGEAVVCTFTNTAPAPTISVTKSPNVTFVQEPGGNVTYTVNVTNTSVEPLEITEVTDSIDGGADLDLTSTGAPILLTDCDDLVGDTLAPGASGSCQFTAAVAGNGGTSEDDEVTVVAQDSDDNEATDSDEASVDIVDVAPAISVAKTSDPTAIAEPGGSIAYTVWITNTGVESITIDSISDSIEGGAAIDVTQTAGVVTLTGCNFLIGATLNPSDTATCTFVVTQAADLSAFPDGFIDDTVTVNAHDDDDNVSDTADAKVAVTDALPKITVTKTATPTSVAETAPGAQAAISYQVDIKNDSAEAVTIDEITDAVDGGAAADVAGTCDDLIGDSLAAGATVSCTFSADVSGQSGDVVNDVVAVTASDNEGNDASDDDPASVTFTDVGSSIDVTKTANVDTVAENGGNVNYTVGVKNTSTTDSITIGSVTDSVDGAPAVPAGGTCGALIGTVLTPGQSTSCTFTLFVAGNAGDSVPDTATVSGTDDDGQPVSDSANETVRITDLPSSLKVEKLADVASLPEPGGLVTYTVTITNPSVADSITLDKITDSVNGGAATDVLGTCDDLIGTVLAPTDTVNCTFTSTIANAQAGDQVNDTVVVDGTDDDDQPVSAQGSEVVDITDTGSSLTVTKEAGTPTVPEPGADVTYTVTIKNTSATDSITIDKITDSVDGGPATDVTGTCDDLLGTVLAPGGEVQCEFTKAVVGNAGDTVPDTVVVDGTDDDDQPVSAQGSAAVDVTDVAPGITVVKTASPTSVAETGPGESHPVTYFVQIKNDSVEEVRIDSIVDSVEGAPAVAVAGTCDDLLNTLFAVGADVTCAFTMNVSGDAGDTVDDLVTVTAHDDEQNEATDSDPASVAITDLDSSLSVTKTANVASVAENGGPVTYTVGITNTSVADTVVLTSIVDSVEGGAAAPVAGTCDDLIGSSLAPGASTSCTFTMTVSGNAGDVVDDTVTVSGVDDDQDPVSDSADESVAISDLAPSITVTKVANVDSVPEPGGNVTYTVTILNTSGADTVTIDSITDSVDGGAATDVAGTCDDLIGTSLAPGASTNCTFTAAVAGEAGDIVNDTVTVDGTSDDDDPVTASGSESVDITDVGSSLAVTKTANVTSVPEPGGPVNYTVKITNTSATDSITIDSIEDSVDGGVATDVAGTCDDLIGSVLTPGQSVSCAFSATVNGDAGDTVGDTVTVDGTDDDDDPVTASGSETVDVTDVLPTITVDKTADPVTVGETGSGTAPVTYTVKIANTSIETVTIDSIVDAVDGGAATDVAGTCDDLIGTTLAAGASTTCTFTANVSGDFGESTSDTVTVKASDNEENDASDDGSATVRFTNVASSILVEKDAGTTSIAEPGGPVLYTVKITNTSATDTVTIDTVKDSVEGGAATDVAGTCDDLIGTTLAAGASTTCQFSMPVSGNAGDTIDDLVTVTGTDDDDQPVSDSDDASVTITDLSSALEVEKTANVSSVQENGGPVTYTVKITNTSVADSIVLDSIKDSVEGGPATDVAGTCDDLIGTSLAAGASVSCEFTATVSGNAGDSVGDTVTVDGTDDDGQPVSAQGSEVVDIVDVSSSIVVTKTANVGSVSEPGGDVTYTVQITNTSSSDDIVIDSITDSVEGGAATDVAGTCDDLIGTTLAAGASTSCTFTVPVTGNAGDSVDDTVVVTGTDDDDEEVSGQGSEVVDITDVLPTITVDKSADPLAVAETRPGGSHPVTYTVQITSTSVESVRIDSILDSVEGAPASQVAGTCDDLLNTLLAAGASTSCTFTMNVSGDAGDSVDDTVTVSAHDDEENTATAQDDASVAITGLGSSLDVTKTANVASVAEPGGDVTYTVDIENTSVADTITITSITDAVDGGSAADVDGTCDDLIGTTLAPGASTSCTFTMAVSGAPGDSVSDVVTVSGLDDDEDPVSDTGSEVVDITDVGSSLLVTKAANVDSVQEPGGSVTYTVQIENTSATDTITIDSITDSVDGGAATDVAGTCDDLIGTTLAPGASASCTFTVQVTGDAGDSVGDTVVVKGTDDDDDPVSGEGSETVDVTDVLPTISVTKTATPSSVAETSGSGTRTVTYTVTIQNDSPEPVTIDSILDSVEGGAATAVAGTCDDLIGTTLAAQTGTSCQFDMEVSGNAGDTVDDLVTVTVSDDDENQGSDQDDATVTFTDVGSSLLVTKTADPGSVPENGGPVTYTVDITNTSSTDTITIDSVQDSVEGGAAADVAGTCDDLIGTTLAPGASTSCTFTMTVTGNAGDVVDDTVTVSGTDDDDQPVSDSGDESVAISDVASSLLVSKVADVASLPENGGPVTYTVTVTNTSPADAVTIDSIVDSVNGGAAADVGGTCDDLIGTVLDPGESATCTFTMTVTGNAGDVIGDTVTVTGTDDDDGPVSGSGSEVVDITDVAAALSVTKTPSPSAVDEPGADVTYTVGISNDSESDTIVIDTITDAINGGTPFDVTGTCDDLIGTSLAPGAETSCAFTMAVTGNGGDVVQDTVTVTAHDDDPIITFAGADADEAAIQTSAPSSLSASASAVVDVLDVPPTGTVTKTGDVDSVPESGGNVVFTVVATNTSPNESVTVTEITDTIDGSTLDLTSTGGPITATTCATGTVLPPGGSYQCQFTYAIPAGSVGDVTSDTVAVTLTDDEDNSVTPSDTEEVEQTDVAPTITVVKDNGDASIPAPGDEVDFDVAVTNTSFEPVTLTKLTDSVDGGDPFDVTTVADPLTATTCALGGVIQPGATYECTFTLVVSSDEAATIPDEVLATAVDDDDTEVTASDGAITTVTASADLKVEKELLSDGLIPGAQGTYALAVSNLGPSTAANVVVVDTLPEGLTGVSAEGVGFDCSVEPAVVTCTTDSLSAGTAVKITIVVDVAASAAGTTVTNVAEVDSDTDDPDRTNNRDDLETEVGRVEDVTTTVTTTAPPAAPPTVVESLARTGGDPVGLLTFGIVMLGLGGLVLFARRQRFARRG